jgi:hypothetical protein
LQGKNIKSWKFPFFYTLNYSAMEDQASFRILYSFTGPAYQKYHNVYHLQNEHFSLPTTWSVEPGTTDIGHDYCHGEWIFHG